MDVAPQDHVLIDVSPSTRRSGDELVGAVEIAPTMWFPGTTQVRTSLFAMWTDTMAGRLVVDLVRPRVPVTLELDVHVLDARPGTGTIEMVARAAKTGRSVNALEVEFTRAGELVAFGGGSFVVAPDPDLVIPADVLAEVDELIQGATSSVPLVERAGCTVRAPGVAAMPMSDATVNASNTLNGGLIGLAVEEAVLSASPGSVPSSLSLRFLRPVRVGPAVAVAEDLGGVLRVEVRDEGADDRLAVLATVKP